MVKVIYLVIKLSGISGTIVLSAVQGERCQMGRARQDSRE